MRLPRLRFLCIVSLGILCALLSSCIDGQEELTILDDGSGTMQISYNIPLRALSASETKQLEDFIKEVDQRHASITLTHFSTQPSGFGMQRLEASLEFTSIQEVAKIYEDEICGPNAPQPEPQMKGLIEKACALVGKFRTTFTGLSVSVDREVDLQPLFEAKITNPKALGESEFRYIMHLPHAVGETNATSVSEDRKTLQWTVKLRDHFDKPIIMHSSIPLPWWLVLGTGAIALLLLLLIVWLVRKLFRQKSKTQQNPTCPDCIQ